MPLYIFLLLVYIISCPVSLLLSYMLCDLLKDEMEEAFPGINLKALFNYVSFIPVFNTLTVFWAAYSYLVLFTEYLKERWEMLTKKAHKQ